MNTLLNFFFFCMSDFSCYLSFRFSFSVSFGYAVVGPGTVLLSCLSLFSFVYSPSLSYTHPPLSATATTTTITSTTTPPAPQTWLYLLPPFLFSYPPTSTSLVPQHRHPPSFYIPITAVPPQPRKWHSRLRRPHPQGLISSPLHYITLPLAASLHCVT